MSILYMFLSHVLKKLNKFTPENLQMAPPPPPVPIVAQPPHHYPNHYGGSGHYDDDVIHQVCSLSNQSERLFYL